MSYDNPGVAAPNRRVTPRVSISIAVRKRVGRREFLCQAGDISTSGIFLAEVEGEPQPLGAKCRLEFSLPGSKVMIAARGCVVRQAVNGRFYLSGVRFAAIAPSHRRLIGRYVRNPLPRTGRQAHCL
jgi:c-di-GMP-binding flagellar brake protein YcgR